MEKTTRKIIFRNYLWAIPKEAFREGLDVQALNGMCMGCPPQFEKVTVNIKKDFLKRNRGVEAEAFWNLEEFAISSRRKNEDGTAVVMAMVPSRWGNAQSDLILLHVGNYRLLRREAGDEERLGYAEFEFF